MSGRVVVLRARAEHLPLPDASIDAVVCDPPYGLEFMGKEWDTFKTGDGFRRSRNDADAGRDSVFGRTSRTSPEYIRGGLGKQPGFGQADGSKFRQNMGTPSWGASGNPTCGNCGGDKYRNGARRCACDSPDFPNHMAGQMAVFQSWCESWARECLRVLKPGGYLLAFGGTRTSHRLACGIEDAGFEIRDATADLTGREAPGLMWIYGSGMPKSRDAARAVDMQVCPLPGRHHMRKVPADPRPDDHVCPESEEGQLWQGWGSTQKPAWEPIVVGRKPLAGTMGRNLLEHGTGALNVAACQVGAEPRVNNAGGASSLQRVSRVEQGYRPTVTESRNEASEVAGRWPPNVVFTHSPECVPAGTRKVRGCGGPKKTDGGDSSMFGLGQPGHVYGEHGLETVESTEGCVPGCPVAELDAQSGTLTSGANPTRRGSDKFRDAYGDFAGQAECVARRGVDSGGASRFFPVFRYEAKASSAERPRIPRTVLRLRADLADEQRAYVLAELRKAGIDAA